MMKPQLLTFYVYSGESIIHPNQALNRLDALGRFAKIVEFNMGEWLALGLDEIRLVVPNPDGTRDTLSTVSLKKLVSRREFAG